VANLNHVILAGNLTGNPEMRYTPKTNTPSVSMTIAVNRAQKKGEGAVAFVPLKALGKIAEVANTYLKKGSGVLIAGRLQTRSYEKNVQRRYFMEVLVNELQFLDKGNSNGSGSTNTDVEEFGEEEEVEDDGAF